MSDATKFAISILLLFLSMICFFFAFHPGGVVYTDSSGGSATVSNPQNALEALSQAFQMDISTPGASSG